MICIKYFNHRFIVFTCMNISFVKTEGGTVEPIRATQEVKKTDVSGGLRANQFERF